MSEPTQISFSTIDEAVKALSEGGLVVVMDDEDRENEGDLLLAARHATPANVAFVLRHSTGILCAPMPAATADALDLPPMVDSNTCPKGTAFTVTVDVRDGTTTGVSAADRAATFRALADGSGATTADDFIRPGHVFPLRARPGGVRTRRGHTEAAVDLCELAGIYPPVGVIGEIMDKDSGEMKRLQGCYELARDHNLPIITVEQLVRYLDARDAAAAAQQSEEVRLVAECTVPIERSGAYLGEWQMKVYAGEKKGQHDEPHSHIIALVKGDVTADDGRAVLARVHSECFTGNTIGSMRCDCNDQLTEALKMVADAGRGVVLYVQGHEGRGIGLVNKIKAYKLQTEERLNTYEANTALGLPVDERNYETSRAIFAHLGIRTLRLITNNPSKIDALRGMVADSVPLLSPVNEHNAGYLKAKRDMEQQLSTLKRSTDSAGTHRQLKRSIKSILDEHPVSGVAAAKESGVSAAVSAALLEEAQAFNAYAAAPSVALGAGCSIETSHITKEMPLTIPDHVDTTRLRVGIVRTLWNEGFVGPLTAGCKKGLAAAGVPEKNVVEVSVPGSFELPYAALSLAQSGKVDAVVALGVLIKGETAHFENISAACANGLMEAGLKTGVPVLYGVLNCYTTDQAKARCLAPSQLPMSLGLSAVRMAALKTNAL